MPFIKYRANSSAPHIMAVWLACWLLEVTDMACGFATCTVMAVWLARLPATCVVLVARCPGCAGLSHLMGLFHGWSCDTLILTPSTLSGVCVSSLKCLHTSQHILVDPKMGGA
jgi:hypothetical protein